ncbi:hypothetical protein BC826DRAFT_1055598 [Russula brevipes]|nr:hypothetical protein BC826DRAFT_1055598 [Russula brevipes]
MVMVFMYGALRVNEQDKFVRWGWPPWATFFQLHFGWLQRGHVQTLKHFRNVSKFSIQASTSGPGFPSTTAAIETEKPPTPPLLFTQDIKNVQRRMNLLPQMNNRAHHTTTRNLPWRQTLDSEPQIHPGDSSVSSWSRTKERVRRVGFHMIPECMMGARQVHYYCTSTLWGFILITR